MAQISASSERACSQQGDIEVIVRVLEGVHGSHAGDVAELMADLQARDGASLRLEAWQLVTARLRHREASRGALRHRAVC